MTELTIATYLVIAFLVGTIPWGVLIASLFRINLREVGSGNIGATNVGRALGPLGFAVVFILDAAKGFLPVLILSPLLPIGSSYGFAIALGIASILGCIFNPWLRFRGGKAVATAAGVTLALIPIPLGVALLSFIVVLLITRYVSLGSLCAALVLPIVVHVLAQFRGWTETDLWVEGYALLITLVIFFTHRKNISRLISGTETRIGRSKAV